MRILLVAQRGVETPSGLMQVYTNLSRCLRKLGVITETLLGHGTIPLLLNALRISPKVDILIAIGNQASSASLAFKTKPSLWIWDEVPEQFWDWKDIPLYHLLHYLRTHRRVCIVASNQKDTDCIERLYKKVDCIVPYGIDHEFYSQGTRTNRDGTFKLLQVGYIGRGKNQLDTLEVFKRFLEKYPNSSLTLVGPKVPLGSGAQYWDHVKAIIEKDKLPVIMTGQQTREQVRDWYYASDAHIAPVGSTGAQLTLLESLVTGLPVITSNKFCRGGLLGEFGIITDDYMEGLCKVYSDWEYYHTKALEGGKWVKVNLTWEKYTENLLEIIRRSR